jgi:hypothetical protein
MILTALACFCGHAGGLDQLLADRAAIERVYQAHRTGATAACDPGLPASELRRLVARDLDREQVLRLRYQVEISSNQIAAEVARINQTSLAPAMLAEIKAALDHDPARFAESFAKPIVVDRELRRRFANDDAVHAAGRQECEAARGSLLTAKASGASAAELVAQLAKNHPGAVRPTTWSLRPPLATPAPEAAARTYYFNDLPPQLRQVLAVQLRNAGDVSAVIETPETFILFVAVQKDAAQLSVVSLSIPKLDCDTWVASQAPHSPG